MSAYSDSANKQDHATFEREMQNMKPAPQPPEAEHPKVPEPGGDFHSSCVLLPDFKRLHYFYGQMLGVADFQTEQNFFREKLKLHNRCLHGYGVVCGLKVVPDPKAPPCQPAGDAEVKDIRTKLEALQKQRAEAVAKGDEQKVKQLDAEIEELRRQLDKVRTEECDAEIPTRVQIECGLAIDCCGNELLVRHELSVDLWRYLSRDDRNRVTDGGHTIYLSLCYCEEPINPSRPVLPDSCGAISDCNYGMLRDSVRVHVSVDPPEPDKRCATCCNACGEECVLLARIDEFYRGWPIDPENIHNEVRRPITIYQYTTITGISWTDGAEYTENEAETLMGVNPNESEQGPKGYLLVTFSRPVRTSTIKPGVIDVWMIEGGGGRRSDIFNLEVEYVDLPQTPTTDRIRFRVKTDESPNPGDRVLITLRAARLLDECCRPVDGANTGGRTPFVIDEEFKDYRRDVEIEECKWQPPFGYGPWTSGTGAPGANFESWFYIKANPKSQYNKTKQQ